MSYVRLHCRSERVNTLRPRQNGRHFPDILKCIFVNENVWISIKISLKFVLKGSISNILALVQIMAWRRPGDKLLSEPMMVSLLMHICVTRPQWVNSLECQIMKRFKLTHCGLMMPYGNMELGQSGSGNGLLPDGTKLSPEPMLAYH